MKAKFECYKHRLGVLKRMKEIVVVCTMGISTAFIVRDMLKSAETKKVDINIRPLAMENLYETVESNSVDLVILTSPLASRFNEVKEKLAGQVPVLMVSGEHYVKVNGEAILEEVLEYLK
ncbi:PTS sugar transporter subunit IIB [Robertmurraya sp. P23]|uniref:PTS sugar transporter subunit IIB n=1 Tax=Robertmurraya sp. P23 TaxID=3436931 RepID=UPI003D995153